MRSNAAFKSAVVEHDVQPSRVTGIEYRATGRVRYSVEEYIGRLVGRATQANRKDHRLEGRCSNPRCRVVRALVAAIVTLSSQIVPP